MSLVEKVALGRCGKLLRMAREIFSSNPSRANRYVQLARKIAMRHRIPLGSKEFCRKCGVVFIPGETLKVRTSSKTKTILYVCLKCGAVRKFGYGRERKAGKK